MKRIKDLTEKSSFVSGDYFPIDNSNGTKKVNASKIMTPLSSAQTDATRALNMIRSTSSFPTGDAYSSSSSYKVGDMAIYNNTLYRCKTACSPASWSVNASNFEATSLASALTDLNNDLIIEQNLSIHATYYKNMKVTSNTSIIFNGWVIVDIILIYQGTDDASAGDVCKLLNYLPSTDVTLSATVTNKDNNAANLPCTISASTGAVSFAGFRLKNIHITGMYKL